MLCLRCGRCCIHLDIFIVNTSSILHDGSINPGESETMVFKPAGQMCPHLRFTDMQNYQGRDRLNAKSDGPSHSQAEGCATCAIHQLPCYQDTPCHSFDQIGPEDAVCVMGGYLRLLDESIP